LAKVRADAAASKKALTAQETKDLENNLAKYRDQATAIELRTRNDKVASEAAVQYAKDWEEEQRGIEEWGKRKTDIDKQARDSARRQVDDLKFEASLIGLTNDQREEAIALRALEAAGIKKGSAEFEDYEKQITAALDVKRAAEFAKKEFEDISAVALDLFKGNGDAAKRYVQQMIDEFVKLRVIQPILKDVFGITPQTGFDPFGLGSKSGKGFADVGGAGSIQNDVLGQILDGLFSFEGGGYTGGGARSGGLDGKGGYMALLHPQEMVTDLTKGGSGSAFAPQTTITIHGGGADVRSLERRFALALNARDEQWRRQLSAAKVI